MRSWLPTTRSTRSMSIEDYANLEKFGPPQPVNVFFLDYDPQRAAQAHCDKHVVKMILETAQLLSTAWHELHNNLDPDEPGYIKGAFKRVVYSAVSGEEAMKRYAQPLAVGESFGGHWELFGKRIYAATHANHRSAVWARELGGNYRWLWRLGMHLLDEYAFRYDKQHATRSVMWALERIPPAIEDTESEWSEAPPAMPPMFRVKDSSGAYYDSVASYRNYYVEAKKDLLRYTKRGLPDWMGIVNDSIVLKAAR